MATGIAAQVHTEHRGRYGCPRVTVERRRRGRVVNHKRVEQTCASVELPVSRAGVADR
ncbi:IS3 family transposase [Amycolatopsis sp. NPDC051071]|uniref:IS3 family transposase n=1 Tax=Amycolatopsis sp. NPDC051071 TaxID=3154637 RepID=UPI00341391A4